MTGFSPVAQEIIESITGCTSSEELTYRQSLKLAVKLYRFFLKISETSTDTYDLEDTKDNINTCLGNLKYIDLLDLEDRNNESDNYLSFKILETSLEACGDSLSDYCLFEFFDIMDNVSMEFGCEDFEIDALSGEVRCIHGDSIEKIHKGYCEGLAEEFLACHISDLNSLPDFIKNNINIDGIVSDLCEMEEYRYSFASYDHEEHTEGDYYIFRTN